MDEDCVKNMDEAILTVAFFHVIVYIIIVQSSSSFPFDRYV